MKSLHSWTAVLARAATLSALVALGGGMSMSVSQGKTVFVTPKGGAGYDDKNALHSETRPFAGNFDDLQPGNVLKLLSESPDPNYVTPFNDQISILNLDASHAPLVIEGLDARTRVVGLSIEELRACRMPQEDRVGCADKPRSDPDVAALNDRTRTSRGGRDLLEVILSEPSLPLQDLLPGGAGRGTVTTFAIKSRPDLKKSGDPGRAACIDLTRVKGVIVRKLHFHNCWLTAVRAFDSSHVTLQDAVIVGGSYGLAVRGKPTAHPASHIKVERVKWIQDDSAFGGGDPFKNECPPERRWVLGCPGDMWRRLTWGTVHHGAHEHLNGALLGGINIDGDVVFRHNQVVNAYNGVRLTARPCGKMPEDGKLPRTSCGFNKRIWIYDNDFSYVRDNPVELEDWAEQAFVFHNRFHNAYAALSFDGMGGGPIYVYGNVGWFDDRPTKIWTQAIPGGPCVHDEASRPDKFDPLLDRKFDYDTQDWLRVGYESSTKKGSLADTLCEKSLLGRALKFGLPELPDPDEPNKIYNYPRLAPVYVFHNSWYLRAPLTGMGSPGHLRHWNNALLFCEAGAPGFDKDLCDPEPLPNIAAGECGLYTKADPGLEHHWGRVGRIPFLTCFRWDPFDEAGLPVKGIVNELDWDVSSNGFPSALRQVPGFVFEANGREANPGFVQPELGNFRLRPEAPAGKTGCAIHVTDSGLTCSPGGEHRFVGAFAPDGSLYAGPSGFSPPP